MNGMMRWIASLALALMFLPTTANAATDPFLGTWRLDKTKSIIARDPGVKSKEFVFSPTAEGVMITETVEVVSAPGDKQVSHLPYVYGKATPQPGPGMDALLVEKINDKTVFWTALLNGKTLAKLEVIVSPDGKQMTFRYLVAVADPTGAVTRDRYVYMRQ